MNKPMRAYIAELEPKWRPFLEKLADSQHPHDESRPGWGPQDEAWIQMVAHLDHVAAAYAAWHGAGYLINDFGPVDDARLVELVEPCLTRDADRRVFLATCQQFARDLRALVAGTEGGEKIT
jgi:hypothetical protein